MALTMRSTILWAAESKSVNRFMMKNGMRLGAKRFVAGESLDGAIEAVRQLNKQGILATLDVLGESVKDAREATAAADAYLGLLDRIHATGVTANVSLKLTQMGLDVDRNLCLSNMDRILTKAAGYGNWTRVDMEDSRLTQLTIDFFKELYTRHKNTGIVLQAYLPRSLGDMADMCDLGVNVRVVKGAYAEPDNIRFPNKADTDRQYLEMVKVAFARGTYVAVATHDEKIIDAVKGLVKAQNLSKDQFEFQMLYGIRSDLQAQLAGEGFRVRCYVPFGSQWYAYLMRRLAENPANLMFFAKNFFKG